MEENKQVDTLESLMAKVAALEEQSKKDAEKMKMLYEVADKGRVFNYESKRTEKQPSRVKLSVYNGKLVVGWRMVRDEPIYHPTTGKQVGENQEIEILLLDKEGKTEKIIVNGYPTFTNIRYTERIEAEIVGKKEDWNGNMTFDLKLPDSRNLSLD